MRLRPKLSAVLCGAALHVCTDLPAGDSALTVARDDLDVSLRLEAETSMLRGTRYLLAQQLPDGSWSRHPVITAYALLALANGPDAFSPDNRRAVARAAEFVAAQAHADGSIWNYRTKGYQVCSTAAGLMALIRVERPEYVSLMQNARCYLVGAQSVDMPRTDERFGGFAAVSGEMPDLITTQCVLEALWLSESTVRNSEESSDALRQPLAAAYDAATSFVSRCQRLRLAGDSAAPAALREPAGWFAESPEGPASPNAVSSTPSGIALLTCAGLKSLLYAGVGTEDARTRAAQDWVRAHYAVSENPGLGRIGLFTYLYMLTKTLKAWEASNAGLPAIPRTNWRCGIVAELLALQRGRGHWLQDDPHWWETQPELVTAYALLCLELVCGAVP